MIRVLVADDHTIVREGLCALLDAQADLEVVGQAADGRAAVREAVLARPDVVVMDLAMPELHGVEAAAEIRRALPETAVVVLSMHAGEEFVRPAIRAGARGYLLKGSGVSDLVAAIRAVHAGGTFYSPEIASVLAPSVSERGRDLTPREREVLRLVADGHATSEIATLLGLSPKTVETHRGHIMSKLGADNVAGLVRHAIRLGLVTKED